LNANPFDDETRPRAAYCWLPEDLDNQIAATYRVGEDGGVEFDLHGKTLSGPDDWHLPAVHADVEGIPVSLFDCYISSSSGRRGLRGSGPVHQSWWAQSAVEGVRATDADALRFSRMSVTSRGLADWVGVDTVDWTFRVEGEDDVVNAFEWRQHQPWKVDLQEARLELGIGVGWVDRAFRDKTITQQASFRICPTEPMTYDDLWASFVRPLSQLMTIVVGEPIEANVLGLELAGADSAVLEDHDLRYGIRVRRHNSRRYSLEDTRTHELLWRLNDWDFAEGLTRWFRIDGRVPAATALLALAQDTKSGWVASRFLSAVGAAEALHRGLHGEAVASAAHQERMSSILSKVTSREARWLRGSLKRSHEPSLQQRLAELAGEAGHPTWRFIQRPREWSAQIANARNALAHGRPDGVDVMKDPRLLSDMTRSVIGMITMRLMRELGFTEEATSALTIHQLERWASSRAW
jgi:hypothetical protein